MLSIQELRRCRISACIASTGSTIQEAPAPARTGMRSGEAGSASGSLVRILVVEDDLAQQLVLQGLFAKANAGSMETGVTFDVTYVGDSAQCLTLLNADPVRYHVVVLDVYLPDRNGDVILPQIRSAVGDGVAIVMASASKQVRFTHLAQHAALPRSTVTRCAIPCAGYTHRELRSQRRERISYQADQL